MDQQGGRQPITALNVIGSQPLNLQFLPEYMIELICKFLDVGSILNLRLACQQLKAFVDVPEVIKRIPIKISTSKQLQSLLAAKVPFNNFHFNFVSLEAQTHFNTFSAQYASEIRILRFKVYDGFDKIVLLLEKCKLLQELDLAVFEVNFFMTGTEKIENVLKNFKGLKCLKIQRIKMAPNLESEVQTFLQILKSCHHKLIEFKIPMMDTYSEKLLYRRRHSRASPQHDPPAPMENNRNQDRVFNADENEYGWEPPEGQEDQPLMKDPYPKWGNANKKDPLIHPMIDLIKSDYWPKLRRIDVEYVQIFEPTSFLDLVRVCYEKNIGLWNIQTSHLKDIRCDSLFENTQYYKVFQSAVFDQIHEGLTLSSLTNLREITIPILCIGNSSDISEADILDFPLLATLNTTFFNNFNCGDAFKKLIMKKLFKETVRRSVKTLKLCWVISIPNIETIVASDLTRNFFNVSDLTIDSWCTLTDEDCHILWRGLSNLERLALKDCRKITNKAFVGDYSHRDIDNIRWGPFNRLKKLQHLYIREVNGKINQVAILGSFRWMSLRTFHLISNSIDWIPMWVYKKISYSPLAESVEQFVAPIPKHKSYRHERKVTKRFRNLRRPLFIE